MILTGSWRRRARSGMIVFIDTNVIIDFLLKREPFCEAAAEILQRCAGRELTGYLAFHSIPDIWYILRKVPENKRRGWLKDICSILFVAAASHEEVVKAVENEAFADFEDCLQDRCAKSKAARYIITRNVKDFDGAEVPAVTPQEFLAIMESEK